MILHYFKWILLMPKILNSPNQDVAEEQMTLLQDALTKIKLLILNNAPNEEIEKVINSYCEKYQDKATQNAFKRSLTQSANKMKYQYNYNLNIINQQFITKTVNELGLQYNDETLNINVMDIYNKYLKGQVSQNELITEFRGYITNAKKGLPLIKNYDKLIKNQIKLLSSENGKYTDKNGNSYSLRNKVEMSVRYAANQNDLAQFKNEGAKLVWTSSHADASPRCRKWQGRLFSLDGTSGIKNGVRYVPIEEALNDNSGNSIINGYNCRHYLIEYEVGSVAPKSYTKEEIQKEYKIDQKQRYYENQIRQLKTEEALMRQQGYTKEATQLRKNWQKLNKRYEQYSLDNNRAFYRWRTRISAEEIKLKNKKTTEQTIKEPKQATTIEQAREILTNDLGFVKIENSFNKIDSQLQIEITNQLNNLDARFGAIKASRGTISAEASGDTGALVSNYKTTPDIQNLSFNNRNSRSTTIKNIKNATLNNWHMPCSEENYSIYTTTHEYGHMLENIMFSEELKKKGLYGLKPLDFSDLEGYKKYLKKTEKTRKEFEKQLLAEIKAIAKEKNPNFSVKENISEYGLTNIAEFFAEVFANSQLGQPNELGQAMEEWLKQRGY